MSTILASRPSVNPVRKSRVLFDATRRHPAPRTFGTGILPNPPTFRAPACLSDMEWAAQAFNAEDSAADREFDRLADLAAVQDRYDRGLML